MRGGGVGGGVGVREKVCVKTKEGERECVGGVLRE